MRAQRTEPHPPPIRVSKASETLARRGIQVDGRSLLEGPREIPSEMREGTAPPEAENLPPLEQKGVEARTWSQDCSRGGSVSQQAQKRTSEVHVRGCHGSFRRRIERKVGEVGRKDGSERQQTCQSGRRCFFQTRQGLLGQRKLVQHLLSSGAVQWRA